MDEHGKIAGVAWPYVLRRGKGQDPSQGSCAMNAVNWLVHGVHTDRPECASPVVAAYTIGLNDGLEDAYRQRLLPFLHRIAGSRSEAHERARAEALARGMARLFLPAMLDAVGNVECRNTAIRLRQQPDDADAVAMRGIVERAAAALALSYDWRMPGIEQHAAYLAAQGVHACLVRPGHGSAYKPSKVAADTVFQTLAMNPDPAACDAAIACLDLMLRAGPEGAPWSADAVDEGAARWRAAGGVAALAEAG